MGDPRKIRKKYSKPTHPWQRLRIEEERLIEKEYGFKNKKEIWKFKSKIRKLNAQAKKLMRLRNAQSAVEEKQLLDKLYNLGIIEQDAKLENILGLDIRRLLDRRLQTQVFKQNLAGTVKQARQLILHGHIFVNGEKVTIPSYLVHRGDEFKITYSDNSNFNDPDHPERKVMSKEEEKEKIIVKKAEEKKEPENFVTPQNDEEFKKSEEDAQKLYKKMQDKLLEEEKDED